MKKPFTLQIEELKENIINILNNANMPCYILKKVLQEIIVAIDETDTKEITKYLDEQKKESEE